MTDLYKHSDGPASYAEWFRTSWETTPPSQRWNGLFSNENDVLTGLDALTHGSEEHVDEAKALLDKFENEIEVTHHPWQHRIAGYLPDVAAHLAGDPECMLLQEPQTTDRSPLRVWVGVTSSGGIEERDLVKRGVTLAAFAMAMIEYRPVLISPYVNLGGHSYRRGSGGDNALISWDIHTSPLILAELMASLSHPKVVRHLGISACHLLNPGVTGAWHRDYSSETKMRQHLNAQPDDLWLPSIHLYDELLTNPIKWIQDKVAHYTRQDEA